MAGGGSGFRTLAVLALVGFGLYQCHKADVAKDEAQVENEIDDRAAEIQSGTYAQTFGNGDCTQDCSGHEAGFTWARDHNITSESDCSSHGDATGSFAEGCRAYVSADSVAEDEVREDKSPR